MNVAPQWRVPDLLVGLLHGAGAHDQHDGPPLGCGDGDDHHPGQNHDVHLERTRGGGGGGGGRGRSRREPRKKIKKEE